MIPKKFKNLLPSKSKLTATEVKEYYENWTSRYVESFGEIFQSKQAESPEVLTRYYIQQMDIREGMELLDAGCGIAGPAIQIAGIVNVNIDCITISPLQAEIASEKARSRGVEQQIKVFTADFHQLENIAGEKKYDIIYFLESLVHSHDPTSVINQVFRLLKPDGIVYIKDLYKKTAYNKTEEKDIQFWVDHNNKHIKLNIITKEELLLILRNAGFQLEFCQLMRIPTNQDLGNQFVTINNIMPDPIKNSLPPYLEWYEIKAIKPGPGLINKM